MEFSRKNTRKILNPRKEKKRKLPSISDQIIENTSAVSIIYVRVTESLPYSHIIYTENQVNRVNFALLNALRFKMYIFVHQE